MIRKTVRPQTENLASSTKKRTELLTTCGCGVLMVLIVVAAVLLGMRYLTTPSSAELDPFVDEYINDTGLTDVTSLNDLYRVGKLVAVDLKNHQLDSRLQKALPADLRATQDDEVGTIIWVTWGEKLIGAYKEAGQYAPTQGAALQGYCEITVIDRAAALIVDRRTFWAPAPPPTKTGGSGVHTKVDVNEIVQYLADLPNELPHSLMPATIAPTLVPGSWITVRLTGPNSGIYFTKKAEGYCRRFDGDPLDEWDIYYLNSYPNDDHSLVFFSFSRFQGYSPTGTKKATLDFETTVRIGNSYDREYSVSTTEGGTGTFSIDDQGESATITFTGKTTSDVSIAWTVECLNINEGLVQTTPTPSNGVTVFPSASVNVRSANLREGPGVSYAVITSLAGGSLLTVLERTETGDWCRVQVNDSGETGWISITVIDLSSDSMETPSQ